MIFATWPTTSLPTLVIVHTTSRRGWSRTATGTWPMINCTSCRPLWWLAPCYTSWLPDRTAASWLCHPGRPTRPRPSYCRWYPSAQCDPLCPNIEGYFIRRIPFCSKLSPQAFPDGCANKIKDTWWQRNKESVECMGLLFVTMRLLNWFSCQVYYYLLLLLLLLLLHKCYFPYFVDKCHIANLKRERYMMTVFKLLLTVGLIKFL